MFLACLITIFGCLTACRPVNRNEQKYGFHESDTRWNEEANQRCNVEREEAITENAHTLEERAEREINRETNCDKQSR